MQPFNTLKGNAAPLMLDNVDTDVIIRINRLTELPRDQLGPYAFEALRFSADGSEDADCVLNRPPFRSAPILLAGRNFGCGSSREGAVWALASRGIRCVIAESFGDIFFGNCFQNGVLPIALPRATVDRLADQVASCASVTVDLHACRIEFPHGHRQPFTVDAMKRQALLDGMDDVTRTLQRRAAIAAWQATDRLARPWIWAPVAGARIDPPHH
ncbi:MULTISPECIES: 3-isopropylmalate dehydratase small subunit [unclassified Variovorax]|uniref:3-isopropylmalate dehydratase small subunit n=1 Tax=unclassified Variovorax TaxID=663243 RepID=UPI003F4586C8